MSSLSVVQIIVLLASFAELFTHLLRYPFIYSSQWLVLWISLFYFLLAIVAENVIARQFALIVPFSYHFLTHHPLIHRLIHVL